MRVRKSFKRKEGIKNPRLIVIAAEGTMTESIYFEAMKTSLCASNVQVEILRREQGGSSPESVHRQIYAFKQEYEIEEDDELWIVVDKDRWKVKMLAQMAQRCQQDSNLHFGLSNPCFELWLLLHLEDVATYSDEEKKALKENKKEPPRRGDTWLKRKMRERMGQYSESKYDTNKLLPHIDEAIQRAMLLDVNPQDRWPQTIGTRVYLLALSIMGRGEKG